MSDNHEDVPLKAFATIDDFDKSHIEFALDYAEELFKSSAAARFEILVEGPATVLVLDGKTPVRDRLLAATANPRLKVCVSAKDTKRLRDHFGPDRVTVLAGVEEASTDEKATQYLHEEWMRIHVTA